MYPKFSTIKTSRWWCIQFSFLLMIVMDESVFKLKKDYKYVQRWCKPIFYILNVYKDLCDYLYITLTYKITRHHEKKTCKAIKP